jgi:hypothetical protein
MRRLALFIGLALLAVGHVALAPWSSRAATGCHLEYAADGPGKWFNVIGFGFKSPPIEFTFAQPVYVWWLPAPASAVGPTVTTYELPSDALDAKAGIFKWTFQTQDPSLMNLAVMVHDQDCTASTTVNFDPNAPYTPTPTLPDTATAPTPMDPGTSLPWDVALLAVALAIGAVAGRRLFGPISRGRS